MALLAILLALSAIMMKNERQCLGKTEGGFYCLFLSLVNAAKGGVQKVFFKISKSNVAACVFAYETSWNVKFSLKKLFFNQYEEVL